MTKSSPPECLAARDGLRSSQRADARAVILERCPDLRGELGRYHWPLLALEDANAVGGLASWLARHHGIHRGRYLGLLAVLPSGRRAGYVIHEESLARAELGGDPPAAPRRVRGGGYSRTSAVAAERSGRVLLAATGVCIIVSVSLAAVLFARARRAQRLAELRTDFVAAVSHELRTPAASVRMLAELLEQGEVPPEERGEVERTLASETRRLGATLDRMLRFGALARGKLVVAKKREAAAPVAREAAARFSAAHPDKPVVLEVDDTLDAEIDAGLVGLALDNLLANAAKYAPEGAPYELRVQRADGRIVFSLSDRGPGLDRAAQTRVFLPFERADDRLSRATEGTGIGLALVRGIARAHGGDAIVESTPGHGATFSIRLPASKSEPMHARKPQEGRA